MDLTGHIRLHRKLQTNPVWTQLSPSVFKVWVYFLLRANWKTSTWYDGSEEVEVPRGSFISSYHTTSEDTRLSLQQVRDAFRHLDKLRMATYRRTPRYTRVTVLNYSRYQPLIDNGNTLENDSGTQSGTGSGTPVEVVVKTSKKVATTTGGVAKNGLPSAAEWPLTIQRVKGLYPVTDERYICGIVANCLKIFPALQDCDLADGVVKARESSPNQKGPGLFARTLPAIIRTWAGKKAQA